MRRAIGNEQHLALLHRHRRPSVEPIFEHTFDDIDELFARMAVTGGEHAFGNVDPHLDDLAAGDAEIFLHQRRALDITQRYFFGLRRERRQCDAGDEAAAARMRCVFM